MKRWVRPERLLRPRHFRWTPEFSSTRWYTSVSMTTTSSIPTWRSITWSNKRLDLKNGLDPKPSDDQHMTKALFFHTSVDFTDRLQKKTKQKKSLKPLAQRKTIFNSTFNPRQRKNTPRHYSRRFFVFSKIHKGGSEGERQATVPGPWVTSPGAERHRGHLHFFCIMSALEKSLYFSLYNIWLIGLVMILTEPRSTSINLNMPFIDRLNKYTL